MPARHTLSAASAHIRLRSRRMQTSFGKKKKTKFWAVKYVFLIFVFLIFFGFLKNSNEFWNGKEKLSLVVRSLTGGVNVVVFDPAHDEIVNISLPPNLEVEVAKNLGVWKLRSVWELGEQEGLPGGELVAKTLTKYLKFPVYLWADAPAHGFVEGTPTTLLKAAIFPYKTNLKTPDKVRIALFALSVKNPKRIEIPLTDTSYLERTVLLDGEEGYILTRRPPEQILALFADQDISEAGVRVNVRDRTGVAGAAEEVGEVIQILGGKVVSYVREEEEEFDCRLRGWNRDVVLKIVRLLGCEAEIVNKTNFDLEIIIGKNFPERY